MSLEAKNVPEERLEEGLGSLHGCLVEGDAEQRRGERRVRRRALAISISLQSAILATLILVPLFGKAERISLTIGTPIVPYGHPSNHPRGNTRTTTSRPAIPDLRFTFHPPTNSVNHHAVEADNPIGPLVKFDPNENLRDNGPGCSGCVDIGGKTSGPHPLQPPIEPPRGPRVVQITHLDSGMLLQRVEPVYPVLAKQTRREGRVELRAIIGTDGYIHSLQVVTGDGLFVQSALQAVQQWHYKPTYLNGQPVEIDTYITVVYTLQH